MTRHWKPLTNIAFLLSLSLTVGGCVEIDDASEADEADMLKKSLGNFRLVESDSQYHHTDNDYGRASLHIKEDTLYFEISAQGPGPAGGKVYVAMPIEAIENGPLGWAGFSEYTYKGIFTKCRLQSIVRHRDTIEVYYEEIYKDPTIDDVAHQPDGFYQGFYLIRE